MSPSVHMCEDAFLVTLSTFGFNLVKHEVLGYLPLPKLDTHTEPIWQPLYRFISKNYPRVSKVHTEQDKLDESLI